MAPRLAPITNPQPEVEELLSKTLVRNGRPLNIFATLAHHPLLLKRYNALGGTFLRFGEVPPRERELIILRVGWRSNSRYEFAQHAVIGRDAGILDDELERITEEALDGWSEGDHRLSSMVDEACLKGWIGESTWASLAMDWSEKQMLELLALVGFYRMTALILNSVAVEIEPELMSSSTPTTQTILRSRFRGI